MSDSLEADAFPAAGDINGHCILATDSALVENAIPLKRVPLTQFMFDKIHIKSGDEDQKSVAERLKSRCNCTRRKIFKFLSAYLQIIKVIRYYNIGEFLVTDILAGVTIGILHIPQALAFGLLASVKVENGLYTSVWPVILYVIFGTSAHVSMGTSAVICIVTAAVVDRQAETFKATNPHLMATLTSENSTAVSWENIPEFMDFKEATAMSIAFFTGAILFIMGVLKLGFITAYLSDSFFIAFTSGAGVHIAMSQLPAILGIKIPKYAGAFKIVKMFIAIIKSIPVVNIASLITAVISAIMILFVKDYVNKKLKGKLPIPIPVELLVVIIATLVSYYVGLANLYGVDIVSSIPNTIPSPVLPAFQAVDNYIIDCFVLAILIFAYTISMAKICAKRHNYELDDNQELISYGLCNWASSFLRCFPSAVSPPRSMVASSMNTKTTISGVFSAVLLLLLILVMSALFEPLPKSALAAIIVVSLKGLFVQIKNCVKFWKVNKIDFVIWLFTLVSVIFVDIDYGLGIGLAVSLITVVFQAQFARGYRLGKTVKENTLVEHKRYADSVEISGVQIYRYHSNLFFANAEIFRRALYRATVNPRKVLRFIKKQERKIKNEENDRKANGVVQSNTTKTKDDIIDPEDGREVVTDEKIHRMRGIHHVVIDFSTINYMDISGANMIAQIFKEYSHINTNLFLSNVSFDVRQTMLHAGVFDTIPQEHVFVDVLDAVAVAKLEAVVPIPEEGLEDFTFEEAVADQFIANIG